VDRYSFDVRLFHPLLHAGLSRRTPTIDDTPNLIRESDPCWAGASCRISRAAASQDIPKCVTGATPPHQGCPETHLRSAHAPPCTSRSSRCGINSPYFRKFGGAHGLAAASPPTTTRFPVFGSRRKGEQRFGWHVACDERSHGALRQIQVSGEIQKSVSASGVAIIHRYTRSPGTPFRGTDS